MPAAKTTKNAPKHMSRAQKTKEVQIAISAAALELVSADGVDGLALTRIAARAGMSNGPLYGRYDSPEDVALEMWEGAIRVQFHRLLDESALFITGKIDDPSDWLLGELAHPSPESLAVVEMIAVARRFPMLSESVRTEIESALRKLASEHPDTPFSALLPWVILPIGAILLNGLFPSPPPPWEGLFRLGRKSILALTGAKFGERNPEPIVLDLPIPDSGDLGLDEFVTAVMKVVARVGYEKTTAQRVARAAGHSFSAAYAHVGSKDELMTFAISATIDQIVSNGDQPLRGLEEEDFLNALVALQRGMISDKNRVLRQLRAETLVAARHHPDLGTVLRERFAELVKDYPKAASGSDSANANPLLAFWYGARAAGVASVLLSLNTPLLDQADWAPYAAMVSELARQEPPTT